MSFVNDVLVYEVEGARANVARLLQVFEADKRRRLQFRRWKVLIVSEPVIELDLTETTILTYVPLLAKDLVNGGRIGETLVVHVPDSLTANVIAATLQTLDVACAKEDSFATILMHTYQGFRDEAFEPGHAALELLPTLMYIGVDTIALYRACIDSVYRHLEYEYLDRAFEIFAQLGSIGQLYKPLLLHTGLTVMTHFTRWSVAFQQQILHAAGCQSLVPLSGSALSTYEFVMSHMQEHDEMRQWFDRLIDRRIMPLPIDTTRLMRLPQNEALLALMEDFDVMQKTPQLLLRPIRCAYVRTLWRCTTRHWHSVLHFFNCRLRIRIAPQIDDDLEPNEIRLRIKCAVTRENAPVPPGDFRINLLFFVSDWSEARLTCLATSLRCSMNDTDTEEVLTDARWDEISLTKHLKYCQDMSIPTTWIEVTYFPS